MLFVASGARYHLVLPFGPSLEARNDVSGSGGVGGGSGGKVVPLVAVRVVRVVKEVRVAIW